MNEQTLLLRQVHPNFFQEGALTSQAFMPFPKDDGHLSVYDHDQISPADSYHHYTVVLSFLSIGVWAVTCSEGNSLGLNCQPDPLETSPAHAYIDFGDRAEKECRKLAKKLREFADKRRRLHPA